MVVGGEDVEDRDVDRLQVDPVAADFDFALHQFIALVKIPGELAAGRAGLVRAVEDPFLHAHEGGEPVAVVQDIQRVQVFLPGQLVRPQHQEQPVQELAGDIAQRVHGQIHVHVPDQVTEQVAGGVEVHRRHAGHQVGDLVPVQGGVTEAEGAALAHAQQVDAVRAVALPDDVHRVVQVAVDVIIQRQARIAIVGTTPVEQVHVQAGLEQPLDQ